MTRFLIKLIINGILVYLISQLLPGVHTESFTISIVVALVLALLNAIVKPILKLISIPITILTLGLFLFVINALIILICNELVSGFEVGGFWNALLFSIILSLAQSLFGTK